MDCLTALAKPISVLIWCAKVRKTKLLLRLFPCQTPRTSGTVWRNYRKVQLNWWFKAKRFAWVIYKYASIKAYLVQIACSFGYSCDLVKCGGDLWWSSIHADWVGFNRGKRHGLESGGWGDPWISGCSYLQPFLHVPDRQRCQQRKWRDWDADTCWKIQVNFNWGLRFQAEGWVQFCRRLKNGNGL